MLLAATDIVARGGGNGGPGPLFIILLLGLLGLFLMKRYRYRTGGGPHGSSPMGDLQRRFAAGEINQAEFEHRRAVLKGSKDIPPAPATMAPPSTFTSEPPVPPTPAASAEPAESAEPDDSDDLT